MARVLSFEVSFFQNLLLGNLQAKKVSVGTNAVALLFEAVIIALTIFIIL